MQKANQRQGKSYARREAQSSDLREWREIADKLASLDQQRTLLRAQRKRLRDRILKRGGTLA